MIEVALIPKAKRDLEAAMRLSGHSKTDTVNRAIQLYRFILEQKENRRQILVRDRKTGETKVVNLL